MKNKKMISLLILVFLALGFGCSNKDAEKENITDQPGLETGVEENKNLEETKDQAKTDDAETDENTTEDGIGLKKAKEIAIKESGNSDALVIEYEKDYDYDKLAKYEIKVQLDNEKLEIDIDAKTGKTLKSEIETSKYDLNSYSAYIGLDRAEEIAVNEVEAGYTIDEFELEDHDDSDPAYYEFKFKDKSREKSLKIKVDANKGNIIKK